MFVVCLLVGVHAVCFDVCVWGVCLGCGVGGVFVWSVCVCVCDTHCGHPSPVDTVKRVSRAQSTLS